MKPWQETKRTQRAIAAGGIDARWAAEKSAIVLASCHPKQRAFVADPSRRVAALVGRGGGKTTGWRARAVIKMLRVPRARLVYIATTRIQAAELMWGPLKDLLERLGVGAAFHETLLKCTLKRNGSTLRLVGADDQREVDKLRGLSFDEVGIDEAASHLPELLDNLLLRVIGPRLGDRNGVIAMFGSPGHILAGPFYEATRPAGDRNIPWEDREARLAELARDGAEPALAGWSSHQWTLEDGGKTVPALARLWAEALIEKADNQWADDHPIWLREYKGQWAADNTENIFKYRPHVDGDEWNQWDPPRVGSMRFAALPEDLRDWLYVYAMDMGHSDPFACNVFAYSPGDPTRTIYHVFGFEQRGFYAHPIAQLLLGEELDVDKPDGCFGHTGWPAGAVIDSDQAIIQELANVYGIRIEQAERNAHYKFGAIELVNGDLVAGRIKVLKGSELEQQLLQLQWLQNEFGQLKENKAQANHSSDCLVYGRRHIARMFEEARKDEPAPARPRHPIETDPSDNEESAGEFDNLLSDGYYEDPWGNT